MEKLTKDEQIILNELKMRDDEFPIKGIHKLIDNYLLGRPLTLHDENVMDAYERLSAKSEAKVLILYAQWVYKGEG